MYRLTDNSFKRGIITNGLSEKKKTKYVLKQYFVHECLKFEIYLHGDTLKITFFITKMWDMGIYIKKTSHLIPRLLSKSLKKRILNKEQLAEIIINQNYYSFLQYAFHAV